MPMLTTSDDVSIHYEVAGDGECLLLLHGLGSSAQDWRDQVAYFRSRYRVVTVDMRGHGRSAIDCGGYSIARFARDAREVLDALGVERAHVLGLSMGGAVAFQFGVEYPQRVASLIIVNSAPTARPLALKHRLQIAQRRLLARWFHPSRFAGAIAARLFPDPAMADLRQQFIDGVSRNDRRAYRNSLEALARWSVEGHIGEMAMPVLFVSAEFDYTPPAFKQRFVDRMPDARLVVVPNTHHALPVEAPDIFNAVVEEYLVQKT